LIRNSIHISASGADGKVETARDVITRQVPVMVRLIDDLLDVSGMSRNQLDVRKDGGTRGGSESAVAAARSSVSAVMNSR
jgi:hypothetical protein